MRLQLHVEWQLAVQLSLPSVSEIALTDGKCSGITICQSTCNMEQGQAAWIELSVENSISTTSDKGLLEMFPCILYLQHTASDRQGL